MVNIAVLVLAGGQSSRMKSPKQLVKIGNNFLLETVLNKAKTINKNHVYCVLGANASLIRREISSANVNFIYNKNYKNGLSSSIASGVTFIKSKNENYSSVLVLLADQPAISKDYLFNLIALHTKNNSKIVASKYPNKKGVPAIFPKTYFHKLSMLKDDFGAKEIIKNNPEVISPLSTTNFMDIDTPKDLAKFKNSILN
ncbi:nucleotidyltransferase family protein [uncultured Polaribacter sp.]|uniref:nucleotidyltransferase family protein n=1 Tax=uncultured Polaribacter sp. TaxID=174711 RepID=UPI00261ED308|nr:nucleotidyltransferase family protein [uncultured Polaribacter sp.]